MAEAAVAEGFTVPGITHSRRELVASAPVLALEGPHPQPVDVPAGRRLRVRCERNVDGRHVLVRPVLPRDVKAVDCFVRRLSPSTRYLRYHVPIRSLTAAQLAGVVHVDHRERETLVAIVLSRRLPIVGLAQYVARDGAGVEAAIVVADPWQGHGIGRWLVSELIVAAEEEGFTAMTANVFAEHVPALRLARGSGARVVLEETGYAHWRSPSARTAHVELPLAVRRRRTP